MKKSILTLLVLVIAIPIILFSQIRLQKATKQVEMAHALLEESQKSREAMEKALADTLQEADIARRQLEECQGGK